MSDMVVDLQKIEEQRLAQYRAPAESDRKRAFVELFRQCPISDSELLSQLPLFLNRQTLSRILFMDQLYRQIVNVHGVVMEFGVRWGPNLALFESFRGMYEPFNHSRKIIGFDTFEGFAGVHEKDGAAAIIKPGAYSVVDGYEHYLEQVLDYHESESPISHIRKYRLIKGDATKTIRAYLEQHPETIVAFAYFDFDIYEPTRICLEAIRPHLTKGSVVAFDELAHADFPGETVALKEVFGLDNIRIQRSPLASLPSYFVVE